MNIYGLMSLNIGWVVTGCYWLLLANTTFRNRLTDKTGDVFNNNCTPVTTAVIQFLFDFVKQ